MVHLERFQNSKFLFSQLQQPWNHKPPFRFATIPSGATEENIKINFPEMATYMRAFNRTTVVEGLKSLKSE